MPKISDLKVLHSNAGYYIGRTQGEAPYSRESGYYRTSEEAETALSSFADDNDNFPDMSYYS